jgi:ribosome-associated heat shock protein Hsp15
VTGPRPTERIDKWLWHARFFKTRGLATAAIGAGHVRVNGAHVTKPAAPVHVGDTLTFALGGRIRLIRVLDLGHRRGPAPEAQALYLDLDAPAPSPLE